MSLRGRVAEPLIRALFTARDTAPLAWRLDAAAAIPLTEALPVAEAVHTAVLSLAGRHFGANAIPPALSGRAEDGRPLAGPAQHGHKHVLVGSGDGRRIDRVVLWAPAGLTAEERASVATLRLRYQRRSVALAPGCGSESPAGVATATRWRSLTPYLPFNFVKPRGRNSVEGQVMRELVEFRGFPPPISVTAEPWRGSAFVLHRQGKANRAKTDAAYDVRISFDAPTTGPVALGALAHFALGSMVPLR